MQTYTVTSDAYFTIHSVARQRFRNALFAQVKVKEIGALKQPEITSKFTCVKMSAVK